ncbi:hypothetical protein OG21DRAFT_375176 [Imleria badia]|nr:hypothetical protein OG21DRAFT_375176 [Imleria badia]
MQTFTSRLRICSLAIQPPGGATLYSTTNLPPDYHVLLTRSICRLVVRHRSTSYGFTPHTLRGSNASQSMREDDEWPRRRLGRFESRPLQLLRSKTQRQSTVFTSRPCSRSVCSTIHVILTIVLEITLFVPLLALVRPRIDRGDEDDRHVCVTKLEKSLTADSTTRNDGANVVMTVSWAAQRRQ